MLIIVLISLISYQVYSPTGNLVDHKIKQKAFDQNNSSEVENFNSQTSSIDGLKKTSYSLLFDLGVQYKCYRQLHVFMEPNLRYSVSPINQYNSTKSYPYYLGLRLGLGFHL